MYGMEYEPFFKGLSLYFEEKIWIRIRIRARSRIRIRIRVITRIRIRIKVMQIHNTLLRETRDALGLVFRGEEEKPKTFFSTYQGSKKFVKLSAHIQKVLFWLLRPSTKLFISSHNPFKGGGGGAASLDPAHHPYAKVKKKLKKRTGEEEEHPYAKVERKRGNQEPEVRAKSIERFI
jgi:hypothetical protein